MQGSSNGSALTNTNLELVKMIESIKSSRDDIQQEVQNDEEEKRQLEFQMQTLNEKLHNLTQQLQKKYQARNDYDRTINETEGAFVKILESSQTLLHVLKKEGATLSKKKDAATKVTVAQK